MECEVKNLPEKPAELGCYSIDSVLQVNGYTPEMAYYENLRSGGRAFDSECVSLMAVNSFTDYHLEKTQSETDNWDFVEGTKLIESRKTKREKGSKRAALKLGPGSGSGAKSRKKFDEKVNQLKESDGGYLLYDISPNRIAPTISLWWFPVKTLLEDFPDKFQPKNGYSQISCRILNGQYNFTIDVGETMKTLKISENMLVSTTDQVRTSVKIHSGDRVHNQVLDQMETQVLNQVWIKCWSKCGTKYWNLVENFENK